jgi:tetratricopeptide (TPR) repeat protein
LGVLTWRRGYAYADAETLWRDTLRRNPDAFIATNNLGGILLQRGELDPARVLFETSLRLKPDFADGFDNLGLVRHRQGRLDEAVVYYREALRCDPNFANAHNNLGIVLAQQGELPEALDHFQKAVRLRPSFAKAQQNLGMILERLGRTSEAAVSYRETLRYLPDAHDIEKRLAWILATDPDSRVRNGADAVRLALSASSASADTDPQALDVLAAAFAEVGRFDDAVRAAESALELTAASTTAEAFQGAQARLALYRAGRAFHRQSE